jgi:hypothetical protein
MVRESYQDEGNYLCETMAGNAEVVDRGEVLRSIKKALFEG